MLHKTTSEVLGVKLPIVRNNSCHIHIHTESVNFMLIKYELPGLWFGHQYCSYNYVHLTAIQIHLFTTEFDTHIIKIKYQNKTNMITQFTNGIIAVVSIFPDFPLAVCYFFCLFRLAIIWSIFLSVQNFFHYPICIS